MMLWARLAICTVIFFLYHNCFADEGIIQTKRIEELSFSPEVQQQLGEKESNFKPYRKNYIGWSAYNSVHDNQKELKFQFSIKYKLFDTPKYYLNRWYFGYTQKSFWSIQKESLPFRESNYSPEFFTLWEKEDFGETINNVLPDSFQNVQIAIWKHESDGVDGNSSRGWNLSYIEPSFLLSKKLTIKPRIWFPVLFIPSENHPVDNPDIFKYYGYGDITAIFSPSSQIQHSVTFRMGNHLNRIGLEYQMDVTLGWLLPFLDKNSYFNPRLFVQVWNGYGESLKTYNKSTTDVVVGINAFRQ